MLAAARDEQLSMAFCLLVTFEQFSWLIKLEFRSMVAVHLVFVLRT